MKNGAENLTVFRHGSTYTVENDLNSGQYPFRLCPECMSDAPVILLNEMWNELDGVAKTNLMEFKFGRDTGCHYYVQKGIIWHRMVYVWHRCSNCGCIFRDEVEDKTKKEIIDISDDCFFAIIFLLASLLLIFCTVCSVIVHDNYSAFGIEPSWQENLGLGAGVVFSIFSVALFIIAMLDV